MYQKKECVPMILCGGMGSRLYTLTEKNAKPAVPFGGNYRIIDFTLSNCVNSGFDTIGVLTQYQPLLLNEYIGNGRPWDLDRINGGITVLPPYIRSDSSEWYKGTANAIYQNLNFIDRYNPDYVMVLSGDHIYKMDYSEMLAYHKSKNSLCTVAVVEVPKNEARRFGIIKTDDKGRIISFKEKPEAPESTVASMGIYIFNRDILERYLISDDSDTESANDFGKNIIPEMLRNGERIYAYPFQGYWRDVGTVLSLWEANMDLLGSPPKLNLYDRSWRIYSRKKTSPPQFIGERAIVSNSVISDGCEIFGRVENSVLFEDVYISPGAVVRDSVIMDSVRIEENAFVNYSIVDSNTVIGKGVRIGCSEVSNGKITVIGSDLNLRENDCISAGDMVNALFLDTVRGVGQSI